MISGNAEHVFKVEQAKAEQAAKARHTAVLAEQREESEHTRIQHVLITIGRALHYDVYVARNDRHRSYGGHSFALRTLPELPTQPWPRDVIDTVSLIDVIWLRPDTHEIVSAFEIEKSTSIYSGILRMEDLARSIPGCGCHFYLVAPNAREKEVMAQLARPSFQAALANMPFAYLPFNELCIHCDALCQFGDDYTILRKIARGRVGAAL